MSRPNVLYIVEGDTEKKLINVLRTQYQIILPGKVIVFHPLNARITQARLRQIGHKTDIVLLFDTDEPERSLEIFNKNLCLLKKCSHVNQIFTIPQGKNLEDELVRCTSVKKVVEITGSREPKDFKSDWQHMSEENLYRKLKNVNFSIEKIWTQKPAGIYSAIPNRASEIKKKQ